MRTGSTRSIPGMGGATTDVYVAATPGDQEDRSTRWRAKRRGRTRAVRQARAEAPRHRRPLPEVASGDVVYDDDHVNLVVVNSLAGASALVGASSSSGSCSPSMMRMRAFGERLGAHVAAGDDPLVVLFGEHRADEADDRGTVGEDADDVGAAPSSLLSRSCGLLERICRQCSLGNAANAKHVRCGVDEHRRGVAEPVGELFDDTRMLRPRSRRRAVRRSERTNVATIACADFGTGVNRLRTKWVRHRCQLEPGSTAPIAALSPSWASEITSCTPERPRATRSARTRSSRAVFAGDHVHAQHSR